MGTTTKTCIATLTIGDASSKMWEEVFAPSWRAYAERHGYTIERFTEPLEKDHRHPAWQKLLLAEQPRLAGYERIFYLDHDCLLSAHAPEIDAPPHKIGAVTWRGSYREDPIAFRAFRESWRNNNAAWVRSANIRSFADLQRVAGFDATDDWLNSGVLTFSPLHADVLRRRYEVGIEHERSSMEQAELTDLLCRERVDLLHPLDRRWNAIFYIEAVTHYPFLDRLYPESTIVSACIDAMLGNHFVLHFAGEGMRVQARAYVAQAHLRETRRAA